MRLNYDRRYSVFSIAIPTGDKLLTGGEFLSTEVCLNMPFWSFIKSLVGVWRSLVSALVWGASGQRFKSAHPEWWNSNVSYHFGKSILWR